MILNSNFDSKIENAIIWNEELTNWFIRNQEWLAYFELTHKGCLHFENSSFASNDIRILGRIANAAYTYIELDSDSLSKAEKADLAIQAMEKIYEENKHLLSENARQLYSIHSTVILKSSTKTLSKHNGTKNRRPGRGHRNH